MENVTVDMEKEIEPKKAAKTVLKNGLFECANTVGRQFLFTLGVLLKIL